jgi:MFS family permease
MTGSIVSATRADVALTRRQLVRAVVASTIGTSIEWYDFLLYGNATAFYLAPLFFPGRNAFLSSLFAFATFLVGFVVRPVGAAIFGHLGDRIGRKATLIATLTLMGVATFLIGLVPTYAQIGVAGGVILTILRIVQGLGLGGEWGGSMLLTVEWGNRWRRGLLGSFPQLGVPIGLLLGYGALQLFTLSLGQHSYWGWRVPFLLSIVLVAIGIYIRLGILETPVFAKLLEERKIERLPVAQVLRRDLRDVVLCFLIRAGETAPAIIFQTYLLTYATKVLLFKQAQVYNFVLLASAISIVGILFFGHLSDLLGRRRLYMIGAVVMFCFSLPYWAMLNSKVLALVGLAVVLSFLVQDVQYAPQGTFMAETFTGRRRYSGASLGYHIGAAAFAGTAPLVATALYATFNTSLAIAFYMMATALLSLLAAALLRERSRQDLSMEYDEPAAEPIATA